VNLEPVTLEGRHVRLEPLSESHHAGLCEFGLDPELWRWIPWRITTPEEMSSFMATQFQAQADGTVLPFVTVEQASGRVIGATRYLNIDMPNRNLEIGGTWIARPYQRSPINTEAKYLMLRHAFETLGCMRVQFKTDLLNRRSRNAILRLGAREEGVFRNHIVTWSGRIRNSVFFSIIDSEWPRVKAGLEAKLQGTPDLQTATARRVDALSESQIEDLYRLYQGEWWTKGRTLDDVRKMLDGTRIVVGFADAKTGHLIAFARVLTDYIYKATVLDVIVDPAHRHTGLGRALMDAVVSHPALASVGHFDLYCRPDLVPFYRQWRFEEAGEDLRFMRRAQRVPSTS
jgi:N-acetyltransferase